MYILFFKNKNLVILCTLIFEKLFYFVTAIVVDFQIINAFC